MKGKRNPVAEHMNEFNKPKTFRNRKKEYARKLKLKDEELNHPVHTPYKRVAVNHLLDIELPEYVDEIPPWDIEGEDEYS